MNQGIRKRWRRLDRGGAPHVVAGTAAEVLSYATQEGNAQVDELRRVERRWNAQFNAWYTRSAESQIPVALPGPTAAAMSARGAAAALVVLEAMFGAIITANAVGTFTGAVAGVIVAVALTLACKGAAGSVQGAWEESPREAQRWLLWVLGVSFPLVLVLLLIALAFRSVTDPSASWIFVCAVSALAIGTPIVAGTFASLGRLWGWSALLEAEWRSAAALLRDYARLAEAARRLERGANAVVSPIHSAAALAPVLALSLLVASASRGDAQRGLVLDDVSLSMDPTAHATARREFVRQLPRITRLRRVRSWELVPFSDDAFAANAVFEIALPALPASACRSPVLNEAERLFPRLGASRERLARDECDRKQQQAEANFDTLLRSAGARVAAVFEALSPVHSACTAVRDAVSRASLADAGSTIVIITDARESCSPAPANLATPPRKGVWILVILIPASGRAASRSAEAFRRQRHELLHFAPWLDVQPVWALQTVFANPALSGVTLDGGSR